MKQLLIGVVLGALLVGGAGVGYLAVQQAARDPGEQICAQLVELCEPDEADATAQCVAELGSFEGWEPDDVDKLVTCVTDADGCAQASGCMVGANLKQSFGEVGQFFKGMGNALGLGK